MSPSAAAYAIAFARCAAFAATVPPTSSGVPRIVRAGFALALAPLVAEKTAAPCCDPLSVGVQAAYGAISGAAIGLSAAIVAGAAAAAGGMIDAAIAQAPTGVNRIAGGVAGPLGRLYSLAFAAAFFAIGAFGRLVERFASHKAPAPAAILPAVLELGRSCIDAALTLAWPAICAAAFAAIIAGIASRFAPRVNAMLLTAPISSALAFLALLVGASATFAHLDALGSLAARAAQWAAR